MRQNLFRGKTANTKEWVIGGIIPLDTDSGYVFIAVPYESASTLPVHDIIKNHTHLVIPETVGQCSMVPDKNGTLIFEGDVVSGLFKMGLGVNSVCTFKDGSFGLSMPYGGGFRFTPFSSMCNVELEVVGNAYDNQELLEGEFNSESENNCKRN